MVCRERNLAIIPVTADVLFAFIEMISNFSGTNKKITSHVFMLDYNVMQMSKVNRFIFGLFFDNVTKY